MCAFCLPPFAITGLGQPLRSFLKLNRGIGSCAELEILGQSWDQSDYNIAIFMNIICIYIYIYIFYFNYIYVILYMLGIVCLLSNGHTPKYTSFRATPAALGPCFHAPKRGPAPARRATSRWGWRRSPAALKDSTELFLSQTLKQWGVFITLW